MKSHGLLGFALLAAAALGAVACSSLDPGLGSSPSKKAAVTAAIHAISLNQEVQERLGLPMTTGAVSVQRTEGSGNAPRSISLVIALTGSKANGRAVVNLVRADPTSPWEVKNGNLFPSSGPPIVLGR